jgi:hypothetical protein
MKRFLLFLFTFLLIGTGLIRTSNSSNLPYGRVHVAPLFTEIKCSLCESRTHTCHYPADRLRALGPGKTRKVVP